MTHVLAGAFSIAVFVFVCPSSLLKGSRKEKEREREGALPLVASSLSVSFSLSPTYISMFLSKSLPSNVAMFMVTPLFDAVCGLAPVSFSCQTRTSAY